MKKLYVLLIVAGGLMLQGNAADKDAKIKKMASKIIANFGKLDTNSDGELSEEELKSNIPENKAKALKQVLNKVDANGDGKVTKEELQKAAE